MLVVFNFEGFKPAQCGAWGEKWKIYWLQRMIFPLIMEVGAIALVSAIVPWHLLKTQELIAGVISVLSIIVTFIFETYSIARALTRRECKILRNPNY